MDALERYDTELRDRIGKLRKALRTISEALGEDFKVGPTATDEEHIAIVEAVGHILYDHQIHSKKVEETETEG